MPRRFDGTSAGSAKLSLTLSSDAAHELRLLAEKANVTLAELVRRSVAIYRFVESLSDHEEICVRDRNTGEVSRVAFLSM